MVMYCRLVQDENCIVGLVFGVVVGGVIGY